jgi:hypothetical protein
VKQNLHQKNENIGNQTNREIKLKHENQEPKEERDEDELTSITAAGGHQGMHLDSRRARSTRSVKNYAFV